MQLLAAGYSCRHKYGGDNSNRPCKQNGQAGSFAGTQTREQLDLVSMYCYRSSYAVVSQQTLGMLHWDATDCVDRITLLILIVSGAGEPARAVARNRQSFEIYQKRHKR